MARRWRYKKTKPGQLHVYYGQLPEELPDIIYAWGGGGANKCDSHLLHSMFSGYACKDGYLKELEARGYDLTTLTFSIHKKKTLRNLNVPLRSSKSHK